MTQELSRTYLEIILELGTVSKATCSVQKQVFQFFETLNFQFPSKTQVLDGNDDGYNERLVACLWFRGQTTKNCVCGCSSQKNIGDW